MDRLSKSEQRGGLVCLQGERGREREGGRSKKKID